jgi:Uncharacterized protein conserved in bacteria (DUF2314)
MSAKRKGFPLVSWELDDAESLHREAPSTFWIPSEERRTSLGQGDIVKLIFRMTVRHPLSGDEQVEVERMWVVVDRRDDGEYSGTLDNAPYCTNDFKSGAVIAFQPRHVIQIYEERASPS